MIDRRPWLTVLAHAVMLIGVLIVIALTVVQFRYVEKKVQY